MIERVKIQNFKSIRNVAVDLSPVTVLIGRSGVGKSNFLRALRFLRNYLLDAESAVKVEGGWSRIFPFGAKNDLVFAIQFSIPGYDKKFRYDVTFQAYEQTPQLLASSERLRLGEDVIFSRNEKQWESWPDSRPQPKIQHKLYLSTFPTISEAVLAFTFLTNGIGWHDFPADVFRASPSGGGLFGGGPTRVKSLGLFDAADNYLDVLRDLTQNLQSQHARRQILARIRQINRSISAMELDSIVDPKKVVVSHKVGDQLIPLDLSQESDGFRRYYAHLLALYQTPSKQVLMFEEPENGIYPGALLNLAEEFRNAAKEGRGQVLLTTQSPDLLDGFEPETIRVVDVDKSQSTKIGPLDPAQAQAIKDHLLEPGELMTVDAARTAGTPA